MQLSGKASTCIGTAPCPPTTTTTGSDTITVSTTLTYPWNINTLRENLQTTTQPPPTVLPMKQPMYQVKDLMDNDDGHDGVGGRGGAWIGYKRVMMEIMDAAE